MNNDIRLSSRTILALCAVEFCCLGALMGPIFVGLSMRVSEVVENPEVTAESDLRWVLAVGAVAALVANPVFGWLSDRTVRRWGHRVPWIVGGTVAGLLCLYGTATAESLGAIIVFWSGAQIAYNATFAALFGALSDIVAPADRSRVSGWFAGSAGASLVVGVGIFTWADDWHLTAAGGSPLFVVLGSAAVPVAIIAARHLLRVPPVPRHPVEASNRRAGSAYWWLWAQRLVAQSAYGFVGVFGVLFLIRRAGLDLGEAVSVASVGYGASAAAGMVVAMVLGHRLARRFGFLPVLTGGMLLLVVGNAVMAIAASAGVFLLAVVVAGVGLWLFSALDLAAALAVVPRGVEGRYLGFFNIARTLPQAMVPFVSPWLLQIGGGDLVGADRSQNYFAMFAVATALSLAAVLALRRLRLPDRSGVLAEGVPAS